MITHYGSINYARVNGNIPLRKHQSQIRVSILSIVVVLFTAGTVYKTNLIEKNLSNSSNTTNFLQSGALHRVNNTTPTINKVEIPNPNPKGKLAIATVYVKKYGDKPTIKFGVEDKRHGQAIGRFSDELNVTGWSQLWVKSYPRKRHRLGYNYNDTLAALYAAGYAEGALTNERLYQHFHNTYVTFFKGERAPLRVEHFFVQNLRWIRDQVQRHTAPNSSTLLDLDYWHVIGGIIAQFDGLVAGYNEHCKKGQELTENDIYLLNADGDLEDLIPAMNHSRTRRPGGMLTELLHPQSYVELVKSLKCSAIIRMTSDKRDLLWGHATWDQFSAMNRIFKHYDFPIAVDNSRRRRKVTFSSSPGYLASVDDFYILDSGISVFETTNGLYRDSLYDLIVPQNTLTWMRSITANILGNDGWHWAKIFTKFNSGTYNNQWMILNLNSFAAGTGLSDGGLLLLEQMPGMIEVADMSNFLNIQGYWASYNIPFFSSIYKRTGFSKMYKASNYSTHWSHEKSPRAKIFRREANKIEKFEDIKKLMRYNQWQSDPYSDGHPSLAIAARYDLETDDSFSLNGAIDAKVSSYRRALNMECEAVNGPTTDNQKTFSWNNTSLPILPHLGQPPVFNFSFVKMKHYP